MSNKFTLLIILFFFNFIYPQKGFEISGNKKKITIPFKFVSNLVIIPLEINGTKLNFLLDTGVSETLLFSLDESDQVKFEAIQKIKFTGFGNSEPFDGLKSSGNKVSSKNFIDNDHTIYIVLDQNINISSQVGFPINGIIGYHFFKNHPIEIKYKSNKIIVYDTISNIPQKKIKKYKKYPISIEEGKPYFNAKVLLEKQKNEINAKLLIDTGNSDALWLFKDQNDSLKEPEVNFLDFLGKGFSGNIYGKRGRLQSFQFGDYSFKKPLISFPDSSATKGITLVKDRIGSIGSEIMKRFNSIYDYPNSSIYLSKNDNFILPFDFNMSGLEVQHDGLQWVQEMYEDNSSSSQVFFDSDGNKITRNLKYKFELKPSYSILSITKGSPADLAGLKEGDLIIKINSNNVYNYSLSEIKEILKSEEGRIISLEVERKEKIIKVKIQLKKIL